jgi:hypothetical protein
MGAGNARNMRETALAAFTTRKILVRQSSIPGLRRAKNGVPAAEFLFNTNLPGTISRS